MEFQEWITFTPRSGNEEHYYQKSTLDGLVDKDTEEEDILENALSNQAFLARWGNFGLANIWGRKSEGKYFDKTQFPHCRDGMYGTPWFQWLAHGFVAGETTEKASVQTRSDGQVCGNKWFLSTGSTSLINVFFGTASNNSNHSHLLPISFPWNVWKHDNTRGAWSVICVHYPRFVEVYRQWEESWWGFHKGAISVELETDVIERFGQNLSQVPRSGSGS